MILPIRQEKATQQSNLIPLSPTHSAIANSLIIRDHSGWEIIPFNEIIRCEAQGNYSIVYKIDGSSLLTSMPLKSLENKLETSSFIRIHQSHLVAFKQIRRIESTNEIRLANGDIIPVSRRKKAGLIDRLI